MIRYPSLSAGATIGVTAPSSGVPKELHPLLEQAISRMKEKGYQMKIMASSWQQNRVRSTGAKTRAAELNALLSSKEIDLILPPWGGELAIEVLAFLDWKSIEPKWILGYSDISLLLLAITLKTGIATAHGTNLIDLRGAQSDPTTAKWETILQTPTGCSCIQVSSEKFQKEWNHESPSPWIYEFSHATK